MAAKDGRSSARGRLRHDLVERRLLAELPAAPARIRDVGCGNGEMTLRLAVGHQVTGVDPAATTLAAAADRLGARPDLADRVHCRSGWRTQRSRRRIRSPRPSQFCVNASGPNALDRSARVGDDWLGQVLDVPPLPLDALVRLPQLRLTLPAEGAEEELDAGRVRGLFPRVHGVDELDVGRLDDQSRLLVHLSREAGTRGLRLAVAASTCQVPPAYAESGCRRPSRTCPPRSR